VDAERAGSAEAARQAALRLLTGRARTRAELVARLGQRGFTDAAVDEALGRLEAVGLIDDAALAASYAEARAERGLHPSVVAAELRDRGVDADLAERAAAAAAPAAEQAERCEAVAASRLARLGGLDRATRARRLAGFLQRRGYPTDLVQEVVNRLV
jgi:regulatory protein